MFNENKERTPAICLRGERYGQHSAFDGVESDGGLTVKLTWQASIQACLPPRGLGMPTKDVDIVEPRARESLLGKAFVPEGPESNIG